MQGFDDSKFPGLDEFTAMTLDRIDLAILTELQADAGIQNQALAERVNLSPSACLKRVRRLRDEGSHSSRDRPAGSGQGRMARAGDLQGGFAQHH